MTEQSKRAVDRFRRALEQIPRLKETRSDSQAFTKWKRTIEVAIEHQFGQESSHYKHFTGIRYSPIVFTTGSGDEVFQGSYESGLDNAAAILESIIEDILEYGQDEVHQTSANGDSTAEPSTKVFVIHGRDEGTKDKVARFLVQLELEPVILDEQASQGETIIEKFESHAQVRFAIALLTPDDAGALSNENTPRQRARQNVIFELGYFIGRLGREGVCALTKGAVEIPSDYSGVVYIPMDDGDGWKLKLVRELKAAGLTFDANRAF